MKTEAGQWWFANDGSGRVYIIGFATDGEAVFEYQEGHIGTDDDDWSHWHHEPRCTGWDWVVPEPQPAEDPDEWVIQDRVPVRVMIDRCWYMDGECGLPADPEDMWQKYAKDRFLDGKGHGDYVRDGSGTLHVMCRRRDLPKVEQAEQCAACDAPAELGTAGCKDCNEYATAICSPEPEQWPKYYTTIDSPSSDVAFVKRVDETSYSVVYKNGRECPGFLWSAKNQSRRKQLTEDEAMALLKPTSNAYWSYHEKQKPQPQKTMLRLWIDSDCNVHAGLKGDRDLELFYDHETRQFYTEEPS